MTGTNKATPKDTCLQLIEGGHEYEVSRDDAVRCLILDHLFCNKPGADIKAAELISRLKPRGQLKAVK